MPVNDLAPGFIKLRYSVSARSHVATIPIRFDGVPTPGSDPQLLKRSGSPIAALDGVTAYWTVIKAILANTSTLTGYEVYSKSVGGDPLFLWGDDLNIAGTNVSAAIPMSQSVLTFRTTNGGILKIYIMETSAALNAKIALRVTSAAPWGAMFNYIAGADSIIIGRDGGFPSSGIWVLTKTNDALRRKALLDA